MGGAHLDAVNIRLLLISFKTPNSEENGLGGEHLYDPRINEWLAYA